MKNWTPLLIAAALLALASGCGSTKPSQFYLLQPMAQPDAESVSEPSGPLLLGPVRVAAYLRRPQLVQRVSADEVTLSERHRWAAPFDDGITETLQENLLVLLPELEIIPLRNAVRTSKMPRLEVDIIRLDGKAGETAVLLARWRILDADRQEMGAELSELSVAVEDGTHGSLVAAQSRLLADFSRELAAALETHLSDAGAAP